MLSILISWAQQGWRAGLAWNWCNLMYYETLQLSSTAPELRSSEGGRDDFIQVLARSLISNVNCWQQAKWIHWNLALYKFGASCDSIIVLYFPDSIKAEELSGRYKFYYKEKEVLSSTSLTWVWGVYTSKYNWSYAL